MSGAAPPAPKQMRLPTDILSGNPRIVPLTAHGHTRPVVHLSFSSLLSSPNSTTSTDTRSPSPAAPGPTYFLVSACKDQIPMLRDGVTGDWIGSFLGHKGAVFSARTTPDATLAVTGSADFTARVWDTFTGECVASVPEAHIVRAVGISASGAKVATGGMEKRVKVWDVARAVGEEGEKKVDGKAFVEVGEGRHKGTIKSLLWTREAGENGLVSAADDGWIRWWDTRAPRAPAAEYEVGGGVGSCELNDVGAYEGQTGTLSVAAGKSVFLFEGSRPGTLLKKIDLPIEVASVAVSSTLGRFVTGSAGDTWVRVYDLQTHEELEVLKGHHGPVWSVAYSPDNKLYATGSEDGTIKLWKASSDGGPYGLWR